MMIACMLWVFTASVGFLVIQKPLKFATKNQKSKKTSLIIILCHANTNIVQTSLIKLEKKN